MTQKEEQLSFLRKTRTQWSIQVLSTIQNGDWLCLVSIQVREGNTGRSEKNSDVSIFGNLL